MSNPTKTALIHIGAGKTGTTAIQECLIANAQDLKLSGVLFPDCEYFLKVPINSAPDDGPLTCGNGIRLYYFLVNEPRFDHKEYLDKLAMTLDQPYRFIVFSCEILQHGYVDRYKLIRDLCEARNIRVKILYCVRDFASHAFSSWRQLVIYNGETSDWSDFQKKYVQEDTLSGFASTLRRVRQIFPPEDIIVLNYSALGRDVIRRFFDHFGEDYDRYKPAAERNLSDDAFIIDIMLQFNRLFRPHLDSSERLRVALKFYAIARQLKHDRSRERPRILLSNEEYIRFKSALQAQLDFLKDFLPDSPVVAAGPNQVGNQGRLPNTRLATRAAKRIAARLDELGSLRVHPGPLARLRGYGQFIVDRTFGRRPH